MINAAFRFVIALTLFLSTPLLAADQRIRYVDYVSDRIVVVNGRMNAQTMIVFADEERIENIAVGDSLAWQITPNKRANLLFIKPLRAGGETNMTVVTDRRVYLFDLRTRGGSAAAIYSLRFIYPPEPELPVLEAAEDVATAAAAEALPEGNPEPAKFDPASLNFGWTKKGKKNLIPASVFDDGQFTYLQWDATSDAPAIFIPQPGGMLAPVNQSIQNGFVVIDHVPQKIVLRLGKAEAELANTRPPKAPPLPKPVIDADIPLPSKG